MTRTTSSTSLSTTTKLNWLLDFAVFIGAILATISGIYFLFLTSGGLQGGRNPSYGQVYLFSRYTWDAIHTWGGILMIGAVAWHLWIHRQWLGMMARKGWMRLRHQRIHLSRGAKINVIVDAVIAISFLLVALSGMYFLFASPLGYQGGRNTAWDPGFLFTRTTWDLIHTWSGVSLAIAATAHLAIHWRWVTKVTARLVPWPHSTQRPSI